LRYWPVAIPLLGLTELALHVYFAGRAPRPQEWADLRPAVSAWYAPGKAVIVAPQWAEPMARWKLGDDLMPIRDVARGDTSRYALALEISTMGKHAPELAGWKVLRESRPGRFLLRELENPQPPHVLYDFTDYLLPAHADVRVVQGSAATACGYTTTAAVESGGLGAPPTFPANRFLCPGQPAHVFVGLTIINDGEFRPRRCIWSHPPAGGGALVTHFKSVPLGNLIAGHMGRDAEFERDRSHPSFTIRVAVDGVEVGEAVQHEGEYWKAFEIALGERGHRAADVEFRVTAPPDGTQACFEATSR